MRKGSKLLNIYIKNNSKYNNRYVLNNKNEKKLNADVRGASLEHKFI